MVEVLPSPVVIVRPDLKILFANRAFLGVSGTGPWTTLNEWVTGLHGYASFLSEFEEHVARACEGSALPTRLEAAFRTHEERQVFWVLSFQQLPTGIDGKPAVMVAGTDVTDHNSLAAQLLDSEAQLENFLIAAANDLMTPLKTITDNVTSARLSLSETIQPETAEGLDRVQYAARDMLTLLSDISDVLSAGRNTEPRKPYSSHALVLSAVRQMEGLLEARQSKVVIADNLPKLYCLGNKIVQVFSNLISNAVKYTPINRTPRIEVGYEQRPGSEHVFFVRDNGSGVPDKSLKELFDLTIVKRIAELHGGRVWVERVPGGGSTVCFMITQRTSDRGDDDN